MQRTLNEAFSSVGKHTFTKLPLHTSFHTVSVLKCTLSFLIRFYLKCILGIMGKQSFIFGNLDENCTVATLWRLPCRQRHPLWDRCQGDEPPPSIAHTEMTNSESDLLLVGLCQSRAYTPGKKYSKTIFAEYHPRKENRVLSVEQEKSIKHISRFNMLRMSMLMIYWFP